MSSKQPFPPALRGSLFANDRMPLFAMSNPTSTTRQNDKEPLNRSILGSVQQRSLPNEGHPNESTINSSQEFQAVSTPLYSTKSASIFSGQAQSLHKNVDGKTVNESAVMQSHMEKLRFEQKKQEIQRHGDDKEKRLNFHRLDSKSPDSYRQRVEQERIHKMEQERLQKLEEDFVKKLEEEKKRREEQERQAKEKEDARREQEEERRRKEEEDLKKIELEKQERLRMLEQERLQFLEEERIERLKKQQLEQDRVQKLQQKMEEETKRHLNYEHAAEATERDAIDMELMRSHVLQQERLDWLNQQQMQQEKELRYERARIRDAINKKRPAYPSAFSPSLSEGLKEKMASHKNTFDQWSSERLANWETEHTKLQNFLDKLDTEWKEQQEQTRKEFEEELSKLRHSHELQKKLSGSSAMLTKIFQVDSSNIAV